jgi:hypothetical protein
MKNYTKIIKINQLIKYKQNSRMMWKTLNEFKKLINNSRGKYKRNECLINVCKSDTDLS